jgi:intein/homing endonuclease
MEDKMITEAHFTLSAREFEPAYLRVGAEEIERRAEEALAALASCQVCPRNCRVDRLHDKTAVCKSGRHALVGSHFPHFGEEDCLRGWKGSGTIFFSWCNLRCVFCVDADAHILTDRGVVRIEEIFLSSGREVAVNGGKIRFPEGLCVYTRNGEPAPVAKAFCHPYRGEMVVVKPYGLPPLRVTPNHPVFAIFPPESECRKIPAGELTQAHLLVVPKLRSVAGSVQLDVRALLEPYVKDFRRSVWRRVSVRALKELAGAAAAGRLTSRQMGDLLGYHPAYVRGFLSRFRRGKIQEDGELIRNDLVEEDDRLRFKTEKGQGVPSKLSMSLGLGRLLGYYCAEGHVASPKDRPNSHRLILSFGLHEDTLAERARTLLWEVFGVQAAIRRRRTTLTVEVTSASLALLFDSLCGHRSSEKRVPWPLWTAPDKVVRAFLEAYWEGDGCRQGAILSACTVSQDLALGLTALLLRIGVFPYLYEAQQSRHRVIEGRTVVQSERLYFVKCRTGAWEGTTCDGKVQYLETHQAFLVPIRRISKRWYEGPVYNLEVGDDDHSYVAEGLAVGNCQNFDVSQKGEGAVVTPERFAGMMLELQARGCHNINFVTPEHVVPQILEAFPLAIRGGSGSRSCITRAPTTASRASAGWTASRTSTCLTSRSGTVPSPSAT